MYQRPGSRKKVTHRFHNEVYRYTSGIHSRLQRSNLGTHIFQIRSLQSLSGQGLHDVYCKNPHFQKNSRVAVQLKSARITPLAIESAFIKATNQNHRSAT